MEFFKIVNARRTEEQIQEELRLDNLEAFTNLLFTIGEKEEGKALIGGLWGEFSLSREKIRGGLRFALLECPNALCWTVTTGNPPAPEAMVLHLTINRKEKEQEFLEEIEEFLNDQVACLEKYFRPEMDGKTS